MMGCLAPVIFAGYLFTLVQYPNVDSPGVEIQTCEQGIGLHAKAYTANAYGLGLHYGFHWEQERWSWNVQPQVGVATAKGGESQKIFELGLQFTVGYDHARLGVEYWHMSNAGLSSPNGGLDMLVLQSGWVF
jgi:hypothetical protein